MNPGRKIPNKNELLDWVNLTLKQDGVAFSKIEQFGTGVGYLLLLNSIHPGTLTGARFNKKPNNEYEYQLNLKVLASAFSKLSINKHVDIEKLSKMKMQDNLAMLQWFYTYAQSQQNNHIEKEVHKEPQMAKKFKIKAPDRLKLAMPDNFSKMDIQDNEQVEIKIVSSASKRINQIDQIIHNENLSTNEIKLNKIMEILNFKKESIYFDPLTPVSRKKENELGRAEVIPHDDMKNQQQNMDINEQKKEVTYVKCRKLEERYEEYVRNSLLKKSGGINNDDANGRTKQSVKLIGNPQIFQYQPQQQHEVNEMRLTDNSILLQSDRKSLQSQNLLNDE